MTRRPNVLVVLTDQWRAQATGYAGDENVSTPVLDTLAAESVNFTEAVSGTPVCCPARASMLTGQYPLQHGVYINDVELEPTGSTLAEEFATAGYRTGYIGKWHLYGSPDGNYGRRKFPVPREKRFGFEYWKAAECTHNYNSSLYFDGDDPQPKTWPGYDAHAQTEDACGFIARNSAGEDPYFLMLSYGPPHFPLHTAPQEYRQRYTDAEITLRANVPDEAAQESAQALRGYYAHIAALDDCLAQLLAAVENSGTAEDTIIIFASDHGDMMGSHGIRHDVKVCPWDEAVRVPMLVRYPRRFGREGRTDTSPFDMPDLMPTLLGLCGLPVPGHVTGTDVFGTRPAHRAHSSFLSLPVPILWARSYGFDAYRGIRTATHTYIRTRTSPWLLYDNVADPYQQQNLCGQPEATGLQRDLDAELNHWLADLDDDFAPPETYLHADGLEHYFEVTTPVGTTPEGDHITPVHP
ncbi:sulfatase family protein [Ruania alba]|uniref:Arylsulfatase A n=1 Tax=Ruania alba TaxID=648782 RepID=A0A1H5MY31_9MICO|nr:sulfatase [Ruania alba]SEE94186.1 Arylsulfatase A [Ruania alba]